MVGPGALACSEGLQCLATVDGDMCVPLAPDGTPPAGTDVCSAKVGGAVACVSGACVLACVTDAQCLSGTVCSEVPGVCVWPPQSGGGTTGTSTSGVEVSGEPLITATTGTSEVEPEMGTSEG